MALVVKDDKLQIEKLIVGSFDNNCYIITCPITEMRLRKQVEFSKG
jgi:hypothetical protein